LELPHVDLVDRHLHLRSADRARAPALAGLLGGRRPRRHRRSSAAFSSAIAGCARRRVPGARRASA
jgi:hypothetical protein